MVAAKTGASHGKKAKMDGLMFVSSPANFAFFFFPPQVQITDKCTIHILAQLIRCTACHKQVYESGYGQLFISKHYQLCQARVLTHHTVNHLSEGPRRQGGGLARRTLLLIALLASAASSRTSTTENPRAHPQQLWIKN